jgi:hypothetical protein
MLKTEIDRSLILSGVRALLGEVPPTLRSVSIELINDIIHWQCIFDSDANADDIELLSSASTEVIADFSNYGLNEKLEIVAFPEKVTPLKNLIYHRHENNYWKS